MRKIAITALCAITAASLSCCAQSQQEQSQGQNEAQEQQADEQIPDGMSKVSFERGTQAYDIASSYLCNEVSKDEARARMQRATSAGIIDNPTRQDMRAATMYTAVYMCFTDSGNIDDLANYSDDLAYTLKTGEFAKRWASLDEHLMDAVEQKGQR